MSKKNEKEELKIDEEKAYLELCQIIAEAIQTQDINLLQYRVNEWKRKYPYEKFSKNLKAKIDYLLNQYYSELINSILKTIKEQKEKKEFNQHKALVKLYKIIKETNDIKELTKKVDKWKKEYPIDSFLDMYKNRAKKFTSKKYLEENSFDTERAFYDLYHLLKVNATYQELQDKVNIWEKNYSIGEKYSEKDFKKHENEVKRFLDEEYLYSIAKEEEKEDTLAKRETSISIQTASYNALIKVLEKGNMAKIVEWIYKNRNITFGDFYKEQIISKTTFKYPMSMLDNSSLMMNLEERGLSFEEYTHINESRKYIITSFIKHLMKDKKIDDASFQIVFNKSQEARYLSLKQEQVKPTDTHLTNKKDETSSTIVIDLKEEDETEKKEKPEGTIHVTELTGTVNADKTKRKSKEETTYMIINPNFLKIAYEKSRAADQISRDYKPPKANTVETPIRKVTATTKTEQQVNATDQNNLDSLEEIQHSQIKETIDETENIVTDMQEVIDQNAEITETFTVEPKEINTDTATQKETIETNNQDNSTLINTNSIYLIQVRSIRDIDRMASEAIQTERVPEEDFLTYSI